MALINFYKGLKENYSPDTHGNSIYSCTDTNECYILGVLYENLSEQEIADKIGTNTYTDANYISKETNLTDAALQLDEEIKATNDNLAILNAASVKSVKVGSNTSNEAFSSGVITIANATTTTDGALSKEDKTKLDNIESTYLPLTGGTLIGPLTINNGGLSTSILNMGTRGNFFKYNSDDNYIGLMQYFRPNGFKWVSFGYANISGTGTFCIREEEASGVSDFALIFKDYEGNTYKFLNDYNFIAGTNYLAPGNVQISDVVNLQSTLDNKVSLTGDSFKNNNVCWGGTTTDGTTYCLALIDESDRVKIGNTNLPLYLRGSSIQFDDNSGDYYTVYHSNNFKAGVNYVTPEDVKSLVFTQSAGANETNAANYLKVRDGYFNIVVVHNNVYYTPNEINTSNSDSIAISFSAFTTTGYNIYQVIVTADGTCTESLYSSFTIPTA